MVVELKNIQAFKEVLQQYTPSPESTELLRSNPLVILLGISGSGRNTIINHLVNSGKYRFIISDTTRPPKVRDGKLEQNGVNYNFRSEEEILADLKAGKFLEAEILHGQQVSGISIRELELAINSGKVPINEVDLGGTLAIRAAKPDTHFFFVVPPNYDEWMYRLRGREVMDEQELRNRTKTAIRILEEGLRTEDFTFIINDSSRKSADLIDVLVHEAEDVEAHLKAKKAAEGILAELRQRSSTLDY